MIRRIGKRTLQFAERPFLLSHAAAVGKKEGDGPLGAQFDFVTEDCLLYTSIEYFGITANDIIPASGKGNGRSREKSVYLREINELLGPCTDNQLAVILNMLKESVPFLKE